jgi:hypothetical protein
MTVSSSSSSPPAQCARQWREAPRAARNPRIPACSHRLSSPGLRKSGPTLCCGGGTEERRSSGGGASERAAQGGSEGREPLSDPSLPACGRRTMLMMPSGCEGTKCRALLALNLGQRQLRLPRAHTASTSATQSPPLCALVLTQVSGPGCESGPATAVRKGLPVFGLCCSESWGHDWALHPTLQCTDLII